MGAALVLRSANEAKARASKKVRGWWTFILRDWVDGARFLVGY
jgi:hypothetical protein